ncbi:MAG: hypothetical protein GXO20_07725 [Thermodesulfobacteria bacterium]|nr:hypothetical protein [Thermodesulfobacteriota bacterium]
MSWQYFESGYERTTDKNLIRILLEDLRDKAYWLQFVAAGFRSGPTILLEINRNQLVFDLPRPWNPNLSVARVLYRDSEKIQHSFKVKIFETDPEQKVVITSYPQEYFRLERRRFYRVSVPEGSKATFCYRDQEIKADVLDISGCGMAILTPRKVTLSVGDFLEDIDLDLMVSVGKAYDRKIKINKARIVREMPRRARKLYGIEFLFDKEKEREPLLRYTIKREIELRKAEC